MARYLATALAFFCATATAEEIPLKDIWANSATYERSLRSLEPDLFVRRDNPASIEAYSSPDAIEAVREKAKKSLVLKLEKAMSSKAGDNPGQGFAVTGIGRQSLQGVVDTLVNDVEPASSFGSGEPLSLVFFSLPADASVSIDRVERSGTEICIYYFITRQPRAYINWYLALIPLGKLDPGNYQVKAIQSPTSKHPSARVQAQFRQGQLWTDPKLAQSIVCRSFSFEVVKRRTP